MLQAQEIELEMFYPKDQVGFEKEVYEMFSHETDKCSNSNYFAASIVFSCVFSWKLFLFSSLAIAENLQGELSAAILTNCEF